MIRSLSRLTVPFTHTSTKLPATKLATTRPLPFTPSKQFHCLNENSERKVVCYNPLHLTCYNECSQLDDDFQEKIEEMNPENNFFIMDFELPASLCQKVFLEKLAAEGMQVEGLHNLKARKTRLYVSLSTNTAHLEDDS